MDKYELRNSLYQNSAMGMTALRQVIPNVKDTSMKNILIGQYNGYRKQTALTAQQMKSENTSPEKPPLASSLLSQAMTAVKLKQDSSAHNIAKMLIQGTNMGIIEITEKINRASSDSSQGKAVKEAKEYLRREQGYIESLKPYL